MSAPMVTKTECMLVASARARDEITLDKEIMMAGANNALQKPVEVSSELENVIGKGPMTRAQVTSKVWEYIKKHDLQVAEDKRMIEADEKLGAVIGKERISMFKMTAAVSKHLT